MIYLRKKIFIFPLYFHNVFLSNASFLCTNVLNLHVQKKWWKVAKQKYVWFMEHDNFSSCVPTKKDEERKKEQHIFEDNQFANKIFRSR